LLPGLLTTDIRATFRRKIQFFVVAVNSAAQSKARRVTGGLENRLTVGELVKAPPPLVPSRNRC
jgi:hypothetical protein